MKQQFAAKHPWTILAAGAAIQILTGLPAAWGVFQQPVMDEFSLTEDGAGYAFGILIAAFGVGCVIGGFLQDKKGPRCAALWGTGLLCGGFFAAALLPGEKGGWFWAVFSIPAGLGTAFLYPSIQSCAQKWYAGRKGLATGVIGGAVGLSGAFLTGFVRTALKGLGGVKGIGGGWWALGALTLPVCLMGSALLTDPPPAKQKPEEQGRGKGTPALDLAPLQMLRTKQYWLCAGAVCCSSAASSAGEKPSVCWRLFLTETISARIESAISCAVFAPMESPMGACRASIRSFGSPSSASCVCTRAARFRLLIMPT